MSVAAASIPAWAQGVAWVVLPKSLYGPIQLSKKCCKLSWIGPESCLKSAAKDIVWAHAAA